MEQLLNRRTNIVFWQKWQENCWQIVQLKMTGENKNHFMITLIIKPRYNRNPILNMVTKTTNIIIHNYSFWLHLNSDLASYQITIQYI